MSTVMAVLWCAGVLLLVVGPVVASTWLVRTQGWTRWQNVVVVVLTVACSCAWGAVLARELLR